MRVSARLALLCAPVMLALLVATALAQSDGGMRRLTFDGHSIPLQWDTSGILLSRPGAASPDRVATELWLVDAATGAQRRIAADARLGGRAPLSASPTARVFVVNGDGLRPALWLAAPADSPPRLLLQGDGEYFSAPLLSPDGVRYAFTRTPTGSETDDDSAVWIGDVHGSLASAASEAGMPVWSPDGRQLAFIHAGDVYVIDSHSALSAWPSTAARRLARASSTRPQSLTPPATIRVYHTQANADFSAQATCRPLTLTVGSVLTIPFEAYVSYVLPIESSPSNPTEHLRAQAVAARTYAWARINPANPYDVSDWTDTQAMCELRADARTTAAANATDGQYGSYNGQLITAMYSAENGDPTRSNGNQASFPYLRSVDDPVSFGVTRSGHGQGLSQGGSQRWAKNFGWDYIQILTHYYMGVAVEGQSSFGSLIAPWNRGWLNSNRVRIQGSASNGGSLNVLAIGTGLPSMVVASNTHLTALDVSGLPDQSLGALIISGTLGSTQVTTLTLGIDRVLPTGTLGLPDFTTSPTVSVQLAGSDSGPSGFAGFGLSNNWSWEGEEKVAGNYVLGAGAVISDVEALNGLALNAANGSSGVWYGPYTSNVPVGRKYRAYFRLKTDNNWTTTEVAKIDVVTDGANPIGLKRLYGTDFRAANAYQEFAVDFNYVLSTTPGMEFRVDFPGTAGLWLDRVLVATYPVTSPLTTWGLAPGLQAGSVIAKSSDNAGNVSTDIRPSAPAFVSGWLTTTTPVLGVTTQDRSSGLDTASGRYRISPNGGASWTAWLPAPVSGPNGSTGIESIVASPALTDGVAYQVQFLIAAVSGVTATSAIYPFKIDSTPPTTTITSPVVAAAVFGVSWTGHDTLSGLGDFDVQSRDVSSSIWQDWLSDTGTTSANFSGLNGHTYQFRVRARDQAGIASAYSDSANATTTVGPSLTEKLLLPLVVGP
jgi:hypothetical protein